MEAIDTNVVAVPITSIEESIEPISNNSSINQAPTPQFEVRPFSNYQQENQSPYTAEYFGITKNEFQIIQQADIGDIGYKISQIENIIRQDMLEKGFEDSTKTYNQILDDIKQQLGIKEYEKASKQIEKVFSFLTRGKDQSINYIPKMDSKAKEIDHMKNQMMKKISQFSPKEIKTLSKVFKSFM